MSNPHKFYRNGAFVAPRGARFIDVINPAT